MDLCKPSALILLVVVIGSIRGHNRRDETLSFLLRVRLRLTLKFLPIENVKIKKSSKKFIK